MKQIISDIPIWWLPVWLIVSFVLSYWVYRPSNNWLQQLSPTKRWAMLGLRFFGLSILGLLFMGLLIQSKSYKKELPIMVNLIDHSASMLNYSDSIEVKKEVPEFVNKLNSTFKNDFEILNIFLDNEVKDTDSLDFKFPKTDLSKGFEKLYNEYYGRNLGLINIISDGNYNEGTHPGIFAEKLKLTSIYSIGVGDTIQKRDQIIRNVVHNDIAFLGNTFPVEVSLEGHLVNNESVVVKLMEGSKVIAEKKINYNDSEYQLEKINFLIEAKKLGFIEYKIAVEQLENESNYENNEQSIFIEVLDSRSKILLLAGAPHPDISAIKNVLVKDENLEVNSFKIKDLPSDLSIYDLIIWHEPGVGTKSDQFVQIEEANKPIWYILGPNTTDNSISQLGLPLITQTRGQIDEVRGGFNQVFNKFEMTDDAKSVFDKFPPLTKRFGKLEVNQPIDIFFYQQVGAVTQKVPLYFFGKNNEEKYGVTYGEGLWRWSLTEYQLNNNHKTFEEIIGKTVQYLAVRSNTSKLRIQMPKRFDEDDEVVINASFYNDSYEPITNVPIDFNLKDPEGETSNYEFIARENNYFLPLGFLKSGLYEWEAKAEHEGETYTKSGSFIVRKIELEALSTRANHAILNQLSKNSDGQFFRFSDRNDLFNTIQSRDDLVPISYESTAFKKLIDYFWWFVLVIVLFGSEWFMRRYNGAY